MIRITTFDNTKCLKCNCTPERLVRIGAYSMCLKCFKEEFPTIKLNQLSGIDTNNKKLMKVYHKWLKIYFKVEEEEYFEYFDTN